MDSRELGLLLARHLLDVEDLHYGWWAAGEAPTLARLPEAQRRHSDVMLDAVASMLPIASLSSANVDAPRVLDDGLVPAAALASRARDALARWPQRRVFDCRLEDAGDHVPARAYDATYFSESFQYVDLDAGLRALSALLKPEGVVVVFDVFARDDAPPGKAPIGGGHRLAAALDAFRRHGFGLIDDVDHSAHLAPNLDLLQTLLRDRVRPSAAALDAYLGAQHGPLWRLLKWTQRRRLAKLSQRWGESRDAATFLRWKTYRLLRFRRVVVDRGGTA